MFTNVKFNFPDRLNLTGDPSKDVQALARYVLALQNTMSLWLEALNTAGAIAIGGGAIDNVTIGGNAPIVSIGSLDFDVYEGTTNIASLISASNILKLTWNVGAPGDKFWWSGVGNFGIGTGTWGTSANNVLGIANGAAPTSSPTGVGQIYCEGGALKARGASGTITTFGAA